MELRGELHKISFWLLHHSFIDRHLKSSYYVPGNMQDAGNTAANTTNDILVDVDLIFPWIFQSNNQKTGDLLKVN